MAAAVAGPQMGNLPAEKTSFVGRRHDLSEAKRLLSRSRLLTLTGPGGVGKTRLGLRIAQQSQKAFSDGVWLVDLAPLRDPQLLAQTVVDSLGVRDLSGRSPQMVLEDYLADKSLLLVLDNCEHLLDCCAELTRDLLRVAPGLRVLTSSREALRLLGEHVFLVPPLPVPDEDEPPSSNLLKYEAVALFAERAAAVQPGFEVNADNGRTVARVVRLLDGVPLAIELAAVQLRTLSLDQLLDRINDVVPVLSAGSGVLLPRQRTLRAMIDWSFELCSSDERRLWARASVFSGSFDLAAAEAVCSGEGLTDDVIGLVLALVDKSILLHEEHGAHSRYRMLETIRHYGRERLSGYDEDSALRGQHRDYYHALARGLGADWYGPEQVEWFTRMRLEHANVRSALDFCVTEPDQARAGLEIGAALRSYWHASGSVSEGRRWLARLFELDREPSPVRATALQVAGFLALFDNDTAGARPLMEEANALARQLDDPGLIAWAVQVSGFVSLFSNDPASAATRFEDALQRHQHNGDQVGILLALFYLANARFLLKDPAGALTLQEQCLELSESLGESWQRAWTLWTRGVAKWLQGDIAEAAECEREAIRLKRAFNDRLGIGQCTEVLAWTAEAEGRPDRAARLFGAVQTIWRQVGAALYRHLSAFHDEVEARLRHTLGTQKFEATRRDGSELGFDRIVVEALEEKQTGGHSAEFAEHPAELTRREAEIAELVAAGLSNKEIAAQLVISQRTAEGHVDHIMTKLEFSSRAQIAAWVAQGRSSSTP